MGQRCADTRGVTFEDVVVPAKNIVGKEGMISLICFEDDRNCYYILRQAWDS